MPEVFTPQGAPRNSLTCDPDGPLLAEVVKTTSDPYVGRVSLVRVFSGTIRPDATVHVSGHFSSFFGASSGSNGSHADHDEDERIGALSFPLGKQQRPAPIGGGGRHLRDRPAEPRRNRRHAVGQGRPAGAQAVDDARAAAADRRAAARQDRRGQAGGRVAAAGRRGSDAARSSRTRRPIRSCCGAWARRTRASCSTRWPTATASPWTPSNCGCRCEKRSAAHAKGHGRHVKQSGGHGQYAVCDIEVEPLPEGAGFEFVDKVVGGAVPRQFIPSVEKGVRAQMEKGVRRAAIRWSTSGSRCSTARPTASTRPTSRSRWPAGWRCARRRRRPG